MAKYSQWNNSSEDIELFEAVFNDDAQVKRLSDLVEAGAPYLYPEQNSEGWKETVIDKFTKLQMIESLRMVSKKHKGNMEVTDETETSYKQHVSHALWIAVETNNTDFIGALMSDGHPVWHNTPENMELFKKVFSDDDQVNHLAFLMEAGAPYLYPEQDPHEDWEETVIDKFTRMHMEEALEITFSRGGKEETEEIYDKYRRHLGHALGVAIETNDISIIERLMAEDLLDVDVFTIAASDGGWKTLTQVLPTDLEITDRDQNTMLHHAARAGRSETVKKLLEEGAVAECMNRYFDIPLVWALGGEIKDELTLSILIENSNTTGEYSIFRHSVLGSVVHYGLYQYVPRLIELGSDASSHLVVAATEGHTLTVKALLNGGAALSQSDYSSKKALDYSLDNRRDATSALLIRMDPTSDYVEYFTKRYSKTVTIDGLVKSKQKDTIIALLDRSAFKCKAGGISIKMLDWQKGYFLGGLAKWGDEELAHHGTVRKLVDSKMSKFGYYILAFKIVIYMLFMLALSYSLIQASTVGIPRDTYTQGPLNIFRIFTDLFVLFFFFSNVITEVIEVIRIMRNTSEYLRNKSNQNMKDRKWMSRLYNIFCIRITVEYLTDLSNWFDVLALFTLLILIILRVISQPVQWVFATLTFFLNAARLFKYVVLIPRLGPYSTIIFKILIYDVPLFSSLFLITLFIFTGGYFISLRTPYSPEGFINASLAQDTSRTLGVDHGVQWVFLSGLRVLLEGSVYQDEYVYSQLNWLAVSIYFAFLFLTVVVFLNVFIAQLSDRYAIVKERANQIYALQKLNFVVQIERTSVFSACIDFKSDKYVIRDTKLSRDDMLEYFNYSDPATMNDDAINAVKGTKQYNKYPKLKIKRRESVEIIECISLREQVENIEEILRAIKEKL